MAPLALAPAASSSALDLTGLNLALVVTVAVVALVSLGMGFIFRGQVLAADPGTDKMQEIARSGPGRGAGVPRAASSARSRLRRGRLRAAVPAAGRHRRRPVGRSGFFLVGAVFSAIIGYMGMWLAARPTSASRPRPATRRPRQRHADRLPHRWCGRHDHRGPGPARCLRRRAPLQGRRADGARGLRLRCRAARHVHARRRRHLHQGRRRRRRPRRQGREPTSPRTTRATRRPSPTTSATTSATAPAWRRTCSSRTR